MSPSLQQPVRWKELSKLAAGRFLGLKFFSRWLPRTSRQQRTTSQPAMGWGLRGGASGFQQRVASPPSQACPLQKEWLLQPDGEKGPCTWQGGLRKLSGQAVAGE